MNEPGPERSGGVQLAEITKQDKKRNVGVVKDRRRQGRVSDGIMVMVLFEGKRRKV